MSTFNRFVAAAAGSLSCIALTVAVMPAATGTRSQGQSPQGATSQVNREEILNAQLKDEKGGSPQAGRPFFEKRCGICHRFGGIGTDAGPDLTTITSRSKKRDILESILWPSKVIPEQYKAEMFELKDGKVVSGFIVRESAASVFVRTADSPEKPVAVPKDQIANRAVSPVSVMPEGLIDSLSAKEIADLLAFTMAPPPDK
jgi:putative heme-binding domain-containing protein